jgi:hypothetical protein
MDRLPPIAIFSSVEYWVETGKSFRFFSILVRACEDCLMRVGPWLICKRRTSSHDPVDIAAPEHKANPFPFYARLRTLDPDVPEAARFGPIEARTPAFPIGSGSRKAPP